MGFQDAKPLRTVLSSQKTRVRWLVWFGSFSYYLSHVTLLCAYGSPQVWSNPLKYCFLSSLLAFPILCLYKQLL